MIRTIKSVSTFFFSAFLVASCLIPHTLMGEESDKDKVKYLLKEMASSVKSSTLDTEKYTKVVPMAKELLDAGKKAYGEHDLHYAGLLFTAAVIHKNARLYEEAAPLYEQGVRITELFGVEAHTAVLGALVNLGDVYKDGLLDFTAAERIYKKVIDITRQSRGETDPTFAIALQRLAVLYSSNGRYDEAEAIITKAIEMTRLRFGDDHQQSVMYMNDLSMIYMATGRLPQAEETLIKAIKIFDANHTNKWMLVSQLATIYQRMGKDDEAIRLFKDAIRLYKEEFKGDNFIPAMHGLATIYYQRGSYAEAEQLDREAVEQTRTRLGDQDEHTITSLARMAPYAILAGKYDKAEEVSLKSYNFMRTKYGPTSGLITPYASQLARVNLLKEQKDRAYIYLKEIIDIALERNQYIYSFAPEKARLSYKDSMKMLPWYFLSFIEDYYTNDSEKKQDAFNFWLKWKGSLLEAQGRFLRAALYSQDPLVKEDYENWLKMRRELARLHLASGVTDPDAYTAKLKKVETQIEQLEQQLSKASTSFSLYKKSSGIMMADVSSVLPVNAAYIDFAKIRHSDIKTEKIGEYEYLAFILSKDRKTVRLDLVNVGPAAKIDSLILAYQTEIKTSLEKGQPPREVRLRELARLLYVAIVKPLEVYLEGKRELIISPDGNLNLIPFDVFVSPSGDYLIQHNNIDYLTTGRDFIQPADTSKGSDQIILIADPDYDMSRETRQNIEKKLAFTEPAITRSVSRNLRDVSFNRLPDTRREAEQIAGIFRGKGNPFVKTFVGQEAIEQVLYNINQPRLLHIATHGFFLKNPDPDPTPNRSFMGENVLALRSAENPGIRSGIALAGANVSLKEGRDDGLVTSEKIAGLRLEGAELIVLSACSSGIGDVESGEGIFGLKRAFIESGAKTLITSLWNVPSEETTELMGMFYSLWTDGKRKGDALREAKLQMLKQKSNPFFWGAFTLTGSSD